MQNDQKNHVPQSESFIQIPSPPRRVSNKFVLARIFFIFIFACIIIVLRFFNIFNNVATFQPIAKSNKSRIHPVILISIDGFRAEYLSRGITPNILSLGTNGCQADLYPCFPSITFPNHYSIATGLYPESHGIVGNIFFDPVLNDTFVYKLKEKSWDSKWWGGEPIWVTSELAGKKAAIYMWPGSTSVIKNTTPSYVIPFKDNVHPNTKFDKLIEWLRLPESDRPQFLATYIPEVDSAGHKYGPNSHQVTNAIKFADSSIGYFIDRLTRANLFDSVNIIIVSDHGMTEVDQSKHTIFIEDLLVEAGIPEELYSKILCGLTLYPLGGLNICNQNHTDFLFKKLKAIENPRFWKVYKRSQIPYRYHYRNNIPGVHGYDNFSKDMRAIFVAHGPSFSNISYRERLSDSSTCKGLLSLILHRIGDIFSRNFAKHSKEPRFSCPKGLKNLDIYEILANLLNIKPAPNNGTSHPFNSDS
ncbi:hypothetical protein BB560_000247 [Smittium megazygosporum]|uniref:Uncharacterized protein n=1 Tax=Smittium megazygosporum TaxID=133381 RepID=A0A2T9ZKX2_9FUNG|nr:hypothetical protein BB560_000247 [Smittium megazygosporum]